MKELTMKETLEMLVEKGIGKHERQLASVIKNGKLANKKQVEAVERSLTQLFSEYEVIKGTGKKAIVRIGAKLNEIIEREDGRANNGKEYATEQHIFHDNAMGIIVADNLINKPMTLSKWAEVLGARLIPMSEHSKEVQSLVRNLEQTFLIKHTNDVITKDEMINPMPRFQWFRTVDITKNFVERYNVRAKNMVSNVFKIGVQKGFIKIETVYTGVLDDNYVTVDKETFEAVREYLKELLDEYGLTAAEYANKSIEWLNFIQKSDELKGKDEWVYFEQVYNNVTGKLVERFNVERVFESIQIIEVSEEAQKEFINGDKYTGKEILANYMIDDMYKRHFNSKSKSAQNLQKQSDFKKRFPYLVATVLLGKVDTKHMEAFEQDLLEFVANFEDYLMTKEMENGLFINADGRKERILNAQKDVKNKIKMYKLNVMQGVNAEMEDYRKELSNVELFADREELGSVDSTEEINEDNLFSVELSSAANALIEQERRESYLLSDYILDKNKERNVTHDLFYGLQ